MEYIKYNEKKDLLRNNTGNISGRRSEPSKKKAVAKCLNGTHRMDLSAATVRKHGCLNKNGGVCPYLQKYEHEYWAQRARLKAKKKAACA